MALLGRRGRQDFRVPRPGGLEENHEGERKMRRKRKMSWVRSQESPALRAGQLELRAAQMKYSK